MKLSIIICTRNRAASLKETLASLGDVRCPEGSSFEVVVVDNGSTDDTAAVVAHSVVKEGELRYTCEPKAGQAIARNHGLRVATGEIIVFTDDDVRMPPDWLRRVTEPIIEDRADAVAGGVVFPPHVEKALSAWPLEGRWGWFASTAELDVHQPGRMVGANMAFHRRVLERVPTFDENLGPGALGFYDDTLFSWQVIDVGFRLRGALDTSVDHHFDFSRLGSEALRDLARRMGRSQAYVFHHWRRERSRLAWIRLAAAKLKGLGRGKRRGKNLQDDQITATDIGWECRRAFLDHYLRIKGEAPRYEPHRLRLSRVA